MSILVSGLCFGSGKLSLCIYRIARTSAHPGDSFLAFENIITGCAFVGAARHLTYPG